MKRQLFSAERETLEVDDSEFLVGGFEVVGNGELAVLALPVADGLGLGDQL